MNLAAAVSIWDAFNKRSQGLFLLFIAGVLWTQSDSLKLTLDDVKGQAKANQTSLMEHRGELLAQQQSLADHQKQTWEAITQLTILIGSATEDRYTKAQAMEHWNQLLQRIDQNRTDIDRHEVFFINQTLKDECYGKPPGSKGC